MNKFIFTILNFSYQVEDLLDLFKEEKNLFLLQSSQFEEERGRYSFLGFDPFETFISRDKDLLGVLKNKFYSYKRLLSEGYLACFNSKDNDLPFFSGLVGYLGYDYGLKLEDIDQNAKDDLSLGDCFFGFYDCVLAVDHKLNKLYVISSGLPEKERNLQLQRAQWRIQYVLDQIKEAEEKEFFVENKKRRKLLSGLKNSDTNLFFEGVGADLISSFTKETYLKAVNEALAHICKGDIYQVNLSQRFQLDLAQKKFNPIDAYQLLSNLSRTSFGLRISSFSPVLSVN